MTKAELLGFRLQQWNVLAADLEISHFRDCQKDLVPCFLWKVIWCNISGFMQPVNISYNPEDWRLFIDYLKTTLKAFLLHNSNGLTSILVGHAAHIRENYGYMKHLIRCINYDLHN